ncbi:unnamed protein product [Hydatigera taeniaeformis]|uniref:Receptor protein serine/threonine kinase n=1 Tax=Hydatigena taeniaeformis TaxID=6205 RepID=A0A0R3XDC7_HYDTA|nr:unnamed protein product [Hydatigera taeniaeformis]
MVGTRGRPALAHRNICLENLYLKADGGVCIGGLEYAICAPPSPLPLSMEQLTQTFNAHVREWSTALLPSQPIFSCLNTFNDGDRFSQIASVPLFPEWWPVCGLQVGSPTYMAPEVCAHTLRTESWIELVVLRYLVRNLKARFDIALTIIDVTSLETGHPYYTCNHICNGTSFLIM